MFPVYLYIFNENDEEKNMDFYTAVLFLCLVMNVNAQDIQVGMNYYNII